MKFQIFIFLGLVLFAQCKQLEKKCGCDCNANYFRLTSLKDSIKNKYVEYRCGEDTSFIMLKYYWDNGAVQGVFYYSNNKKEGRWTEYTNTGEISYEGSYHNGNKIGVHVLMRFNGSLTSIEKYDSTGKLVFGYYFNEDGKLIDNPKQPKYRVKL